MFLKTIIVFILSLKFLICQDTAPSADSVNLKNKQTSIREKALLYLDSMNITRDKDILKSLEYFDIALQYALENDLKDIEAELYFSAAGQYNLISDPGKAINYFNKSISIYDSLGLYEKSGKAHNNLAWVYGTIGDQKEEIYHYKRAHKLVSLAGSKYYTAQILSNIGDCYLAVDSLLLALNTQKEALKIFRELNRSFNSAIILKKISLIHQKLGNYTEGIKFAKQSLELLSKTDKKLEYQRSLRVLANNYIGLNEYEKSLELCNEAIVISKELQSNDDERRELKENYLLRMNILFRTGKYAEAEKYLTYANNYQDTLNKKHKDAILEIFKERYHKEKLNSEVNKVKLEYQQIYIIIISGFIVIIFITVILLFISNVRKKKINQVLINQKHKLELLNEQFNSFFENSDRAIRVINKNKEIILWNKAAEKLTGIKSSEALGKQFYDVLKSNMKYMHSQDKTLEECINYLSLAPKKLKTIRNSSAHNLYLTVKTKDGQIKHIYDSMFLIETSNDIYIGGTTDDISVEKENEIRLIKALEEVKQASKLKSEFLAQMSHEIRTPVNTILSFISLVEEETKKLNNDDLNTSFSMIEKGSNRLIRTIDLILDMSLLQSGTYELHNRTVDLVENILLPLVQEYTQKAMKKSLLFEFVNNINEQIKVKVDVYIITQTLINLLDNAVKYTESGSVRIILYKNEKSLLCIDVSDTGIGMSKTFLDNLFLPFTQEEQGYTRRYEGNGLGLSLVKKYCELMNVEIKVASKKGVGSVFTIVLNNPD